MKIDKKKGVVTQNLNSKTNLKLKYLRKIIAIIFFINEIQFLSFLSSTTESCNTKKNA